MDDARRIELCLLLQEFFQANSIGYDISPYICIDYLLSISATNNIPIDKFENTMALICATYRNAILQREEHAH